MQRFLQFDPHKQKVQEDEGFLLVAEEERRLPSLQGFVLLGIDGQKLRLEEALHQRVILVVDVENHEVILHGTVSKESESDTEEEVSCHATQ